MKAIAFSEVWRIYKASGMSSQDPYFSIGYRKLDGSWGEKAKVRRAVSKTLKDPASRKDVASVRSSVRTAGVMELETDSAYRFEIKALGLMEFNGMRVDHRF